MIDAACRGQVPLKDSEGNIEPDTFFPGRGATSEEAILKFCLHCKVRKECKAYADKVDAKVGVWGGERRTRATHGSENERKK